MNTDFLELPGLRVQVRYKDRGEATHFFSYASQEKRRRAMADWIRNEQCVAIDRCQIRRPRRGPGDREHINTGCAFFDRQHQVLMTGNLMSNTVLGWHVRPYRQRECNGFTWRSGELRYKDVQAFAGLVSPADLLGHLSGRTLLHADLIVYAVFHTKAPLYRQERVLHGVLVTEAATHRRLAQFEPQAFARRGSPKSARIMEVVTPYLTDEIAAQIEPAFRRASMFTEA